MEVILLKKIINILGWVVLLFAFGSLGLNSDDKIFGFFLYLTIFAMIFGAVYYYNKNHHRKLETNPKTVALIQKTIGVILFVIALISPIISFRKIGLPFLPNLLMIIITALLITLGIVLLINKGNYHKIMGYGLLIILSSIPAIFAITYFEQYFPNAYNALGTSYWAIVSISIFSWWGFTVFFEKE